MSAYKKKKSGVNCFTQDVVKESAYGPGLIFVLLIQCGPGYCHLDVGEGYLMELRVNCDGQFPHSGLCSVVVLLPTSLSLCPT